jgi:hypothetical protein
MSDARLSSFFGKGGSKFGHARAIFGTSDDFLTYAKDAFDLVLREGTKQPKMMSVRRHAFAHHRSSWPRRRLGAVSRSCAEARGCLNLPPRRNCPALDQTSSSRAGGLSASERFVGDFVGQGTAVKSQENPNVRSGFADYQLANISQLRGFRSWYGTSRDFDGMFEWSPRASRPKVGVWPASLSFR